MTIKIQPASEALANLLDRQRQDTEGRHEALRSIFVDIDAKCRELGIHTVELSDSRRIVLQLSDFDCTLVLDHLCNVMLERQQKQTIFPLRELLDYNARLRQFEGKEYSDVFPAPGERRQKHAAVDVLSSWIANEIVQA